MMIFQLALKRKQVCFTLLISLFFFSCKQDTKKEDASSKPNVVFLFADDMTYQAINALGNQEIYTPHLDKLVRKGTTFSHTYNMGGWNGAVCIASRSMMISGQYIWRAKKFMDQYAKGEHTLENHTWGKLMKQQGYDTYMSGKWHVGIPAGKVFEDTTHIRPGMPRDMGFFGPLRKWLAGGKKEAWAAIMPAGYNRPLDENDDSWSPVDPKFGGFWEGGKHWSEVLKDDALAFIDKAAQKENPFFMYLAFNAPHDPRQAPQSFLDKYPLDKISLPPNWQPAYPGMDSIGVGRTLRDEALAPLPRTEYATKVHIQEYYAIISHLDEQIGKIVDALERTGQLENTYIFFSADHGLAVGQHGLLGKQNMYDHSLRVPLLVSGPGIPANKKVSADVYLQDIMATSLELAGLDPAHNQVEFHSFLDLAKGTETNSHYPAIYGCYINFQRMIRKDGFKLIVYPKLKQLKLFQVSTDKDEMIDLSEDADHRGTISTLFDDLLQLQKEMEDELDIGFLKDYLKTSI